MVFALILAVETFSGLHVLMSIVAHYNTAAILRNIMWKTKTQFLRFIQI